MKHILTVLLFLLVTSVGIQAQLVSGATYRIVPVDMPERSLFVGNSSLDDKAAVVLWTETDVPAQQWEIEVKAFGRTSFRNVYTGKYLAASSSKLVQTNNATMWTIKDFNESDSSACLVINAQYLSLPKGDNDGMQPVTNSTHTRWRFIPTEAQTKFTDRQRDRMAQGYIDHFTKKPGGMGYRTFCYGGWGESEILETILDMYQQTENQDYLTLFTQAYNYHKSCVSTTWTNLVYTDSYHWFGHDFNDDVMWHIIAAARAAVLTGKSTFRTEAKKNFDAIHKRADLGYVTLFRWAENSGDRNGTNSCINGPAEIAACYIGIATADESYFELARTLYQNQRKYLFVPSTGQVYDSVVLDPATGNIVSKNEWASTYNQGTMLGAACLLWQHYGDDMYRQDADKILSYARKNLCDSHGIVRVCQNADGDFQGFKGILMRWAGLYASVFDSEDTREWLRANAFHAYNNMNSEHYGHSAWLTKASEDHKYGDVDYSGQPFGGSTCLAAAFAASVPEYEPDAIQSVAVSVPAASNATYNLSGQRVSSGYRGVVIRGGKKYINR